jgi:plasmid replication initiation protein
MRYEKSIKKFTDKSSKKTNKIKQIGKDTRQAVKKFLSRLEKKQNQEKISSFRFCNCFRYFWRNLVYPSINCCG